MFAGACHCLLLPAAPFHLLIALLGGAAMLMSRMLLLLPFDDILRLLLSCHLPYATIFDSAC